MIAPLDVSLVAREHLRFASQVHGPRHWRAVAAAGLWLLETEPEANPAVVWAFAMLHDCQRNDDGSDPEHGRRAARLVDSLNLKLDRDEVALLKRACSKHTAGRTTRDPTVGVCWDADRLNLWRVAQRPDPRLMSTTAAKMPAMIDRARTLHSRPPSVLRLLESYTVLTVLDRYPELRAAFRPVPDAFEQPEAGALCLDARGRAVLYHGTSGSAVARIQRRGLVPHLGSRFAGRWSGVCCTDNFALAAFYAASRTRYRERTEDTCAVVEVRAEPERLRIDPEGARGYFADAVTPDRVTGCWTAPISTVLGEPRRKDPVLVADPNVLLGPSAWLAVHDWPFTAALIRAFNANHAAAAKGREVEICLKVIEDVGR